VRANARRTSKTKSSTMVKTLSMACGMQSAPLHVTSIYWSDGDARCRRPFHAAGYSACSV
jgi:hypothetical protein